MKICIFLFEVLFKFSLQLNDFGDHIELSNVLLHLSLSPEHFLHMCIASGCDYVDNIRNVGVNTAYQFVKKKNFINHLQNMPNAPTNYAEEFKKARAMFLRQTVFDPNISKTVHYQIGKPIMRMFKKCSKPAADCILSFTCTHKWQLNI